MLFKDLDSIKAAGFTGFRTIKDLWNDDSSIPNERGVYIVLTLEPSLKKFALKGAAGFFKQRNPNVSLEELQKNWVHDSHIIYIGQAGGNGSSSTLRIRLRQYLNFGKGKPVGHYGGRYIWQLQNPSDLLLAWKVLMHDDPKIVERGLLLDFISSYGKMPFANLTM